MTVAVVKKGMLSGGRMGLALPGGKFRCVISKDRLEAVRAAVSEKLGLRRRSEKNELSGQSGEALRHHFDCGASAA